MKSIIFLIAVIGVVSCGESHKFGLKIAHIVKCFSDLKTDLERSNNYMNPIIDAFVKFFRGIEEGIVYQAKADMNMFEDCIESPDYIFELWMMFAEYLKSLTWKNIQIPDVISRIIFTALETYMQILPCMTIYNMGLKYLALIQAGFSWEAIKDALFNTFAYNVQAIFNAVIVIIQDLFTGEFEEAGYIIGQILYVLVVH